MKHTDIFVLQNGNKVIMMVRDKAHALSIEMIFDLNNVLVEYFIFKICNVEFINNVPNDVDINLSL